MLIMHEDRHQFRLTPLRRECLFARFLDRPGTFAMTSPASLTGSCCTAHSLKTCRIFVRPPSICTDTRLPCSSSPAANFPDRHCINQVLRSFSRSSPHDLKFRRTVFTLICKPPRINSSRALSSEGLSADWRATLLCNPGVMPLPKPNCASSMYSPVEGRFPRCDKLLSGYTVQRADPHRKATQQAYANRSIATTR